MSIQVISFWLAGFSGNSGRPERSNPIQIVIMSICKHPKSNLDRRGRHGRERRNDKSHPRRIRVPAAHEK
jgi:hypothetical protein